VLSRLARALRPPATGALNAALDYSRNVTCSSCGEENEAGRKFCGECGAPLVRTCPNCNSQNAPTVRFCGECGASLAASIEPVPSPQPQAERKLVSVLFADLVGFTTLSEGRDPEEVRELLSRYFDTARAVINRYGGTVEKFIGDAVMAVWGAPIAQEDDAERAVRAGLDLVDAVHGLGLEVAAPNLSARAGVLTGEAAVTLGADGQGMVAGDLVNTASRVQMVAGPGQVLVSASTKRATEGGIDYTDVGSHAVKGKAEAVALWRATRVAGLLGGTLRSSTIEPPFVGRDRELRLVKQLFHSTSDDRRPQLVSVIGVGGIGKSRLVWEFEKYIDGLVADAWWHRGRCLSYGDGVAFWALAEMVRGRAGILEDEESESARAKLRATLEQHLASPDERRFVEPRLAHLLSLEEAPVGDQENLFAAARILFERVADSGPTVLVFEDIHWADSALLDFIEYLLDWSRDLPIFILTLARPELMERRPTWGAGKRNFISIALEPLSAESMETLIKGPVPGLPGEVRERILARAEGVPFYAVETVRMLLDRGLLVRDEAGFALTGEVESLDVPETLQALIAARLDGLTPDERRIVQDAAVLGRTFTLRGLASVSGVVDGALESLLEALVRKEIFALLADPMSPDRGQYGFIQDLVKKVAYDTVSRRERKARHLAAAAYLRSLGDDDDVVEVVAAHYLDAYLSDPSDTDADEVKGEARAMLIRAGERAASLGANSEAEAHFSRAADLADTALGEAELRESAGVAAGMLASGKTKATGHLETAMALFTAEGATHSAARVSARLAESMWDRGRHAEALGTMDSAFEALAEEQPDADFATLAAQLGRFMFFAGETETALQRIETALTVSEALLLMETLSQALNTKAVILSSFGRNREAGALIEDAIQLAVEHDKPSAALRAYYNLADLQTRLDRFEEAVDTIGRATELARRVGNRYWEQQLAGQLYPAYLLGRWDDLIASSDIGSESDWQSARLAWAAVPITWVPARIARGDAAEANRIISMLDELSHSADEQERAAWAAGKAWVALATGDAASALRNALAAWESQTILGVRCEAVKEGFGLALEAAVQLGDRARAQELLAAVDAFPVGNAPQLLQAQANRFRARLTDDPLRAADFFKRAASLFRELAARFWLGITLLEHGEHLTAHGRATEAEALLAEAASIFDLLGARPWIERLERIPGRSAVTA
jgi:class 3 adenylate cyclase/tetratricopeptide (TPR) repeat protein